MTAWKKRGYISDEQFLDDEPFSGTADYNLTLTGSLRGDTSFGMQVLNAVTLLLVPYTVTQHYDLHYVLEDTKSGKSYGASVQRSDTTWVELFLLLALPFAQHGHYATVREMGDDLFDQFYRQGAFHESGNVPAASRGNFVRILSRTTTRSSKESELAAGGILRSGSLSIR